MKSFLLAHGVLIFFVAEIFIFGVLWVCFEVKNYFLSPSSMKEKVYLKFSRASSTGNERPTASAL